MRALIVMLLLAPLVAGCLEKKGPVGRDPAILDAEAMGYACRFSLKTPETCMKENGTMSPAAILDGWKNADADIRDKKLLLDLNPAKPEAAAEAAPAGDAKDTKDGKGK